MFYDCPKSKIVIWDLNGCMKVVGESVMGAVDAASHNNSIYIADDAGYYWIVGAGNKIEKKKINNSSGSEITGISVNSVGNVYVAGNVVKNKKEYTAYWKNGELVKTFRENADWYSEKHVAADSKGNVYIPGWRMKSHEVTYSAYWKNGNLKKLTTTYDGEATDVDVSGTKVYFSGAHGPICDIPCPIKSGTLAAYWQVGKGMTKVTKVKTAGVPRKWIMRSRASSIHVEGSTVYMAGEVDGYVPVYWKNKIQHELPVEFDLDTCDYCTADPTDISLLDSKALVVGDYYNEKDFVDASHTNGETKAVYWHDKKLHKLCECCGTSRAIAVVANECGGTSCEQAEWEDRTCSTSSETKDNKAFTKQLGSSGEDVAIGVAVDSSGNIYVTGYTDGGLDGNSSSGKQDFFLTKYNSSGTKEWTKQEGSSGDDFAYGVAVDSSDNIYVAGYTDKKFHGNNNSGRFDIFLVKYNSSGARQWTKQLGTSNNEYASAVATDSSDNIYVTGNTWGGLDGSTKPKYCMGYGTVKASRECTDTFLVKYNSSGTKQWVKQLEGSSSISYEKSQGLAVDSSDNIYVAGFTNGGLDGNTSSGKHDIFLVKYNSTGTKQWIQQFGSSENDLGIAVDVDSKGNIYLTGYTEGGLDGKTNSGERDIFLVKYNSSGTKQWTQQLGTPTFEEGNGVAVDSSDNIYVTGWTRGKLDIYSGGDDTILVKYNSSGTKQWTRQFGAPSFLEKSQYNSSSQMSSSGDKGIGVAVDSSGNIYVTGNTEGGMDGNTNSGKNDIFLVKYNSM